MNFRRLIKDDVDLMLSIQNENFKDGWNKDQLLSGFSENLLHGFCLEAQGKVVGFITYCAVIDTADIEGVVVISSERKKGYGRMLVERVVQELSQNKITKIFLEVRQNNLPAIALYSACGFKNISIRKKYYIDGENAIVMQKEL